VAGIAAVVSPAVSTARTSQLVAIGTAAGIFSGLFGVGGGTIIVPLLVLWLGYGERLATGTSMAAIIVIALYAVLLQAVEYGNVDPGKAAIVGIPGVLGAVAGTALQQRLPERAISFFFAALLLAVAIELLVGPISDDGDRVVAAAVALGFGGGVVGGLLGVGGGILFVPALALFLEESQVEAEATSLLAIVPVALVATWRQAGYGNVRLREGLLIGLCSPLGVAIGVVVANAVSDDALQAAFAALALFIAARLALRGARAR
jgi:uncharacterized membrane protein YfcA